MPGADRDERGRPVDDDHLVDQARHALARLGRGDRDGGDDPSGPELAQGGDGSPHRRARGQAIVDEDDRPAGDVRCRPPAPVAALPLGEHVAGPRREQLELLGADSGRPDHAVVEDPDSPRGQSSDRELDPPGKADLAHHEHVERRPEPPGHLGRHRDPAPGQPEDEEIGNAGVVAEEPGQLGPGRDPVENRREAPTDPRYLWSGTPDGAGSRCPHGETTMPCATAAVCPLLSVT